MRAMSNQEIRAMRGIDKLGGGLTEFFRKGFICNRLRKYQSLNIEVVCSEVTISKKIFVLFSIYRQQDYSNLMILFIELGKYLNQACENYDNFSLMGDSNINIRQVSPKSHKLDELCSLVSLANIIINNRRFLTTNQVSFKKQTLLKLDLATITGSYVLF